MPELRSGKKVEREQTASQEAMPPPKEALKKKTYEEFHLKTPEVQKGSVTVSEFPALNVPGQKRAARTPDNEAKRANQTEGMDTEEKLQRLEQLRGTLSPSKGSSSSAGEDTSKGQQKEQEQASTAEVLKAVQALTAQFSTLATKKDLETLKAEVKQEVKEQVQAAKQELKGEVKKELKEELHKEGLLGSTKAVGGSKVEALWRTLDRQDPAHNKVAFKGFLDTVGVEQRVAELEHFFVSKFPHLGKPTFQVVRKGPRENRVLAHVVLADVGSPEKAQEVTKQLRGQAVTLGSSTLKVAPALTELNKQRNNNLREAAKLLEKEGGSVEVKWGNDREVQVNNQVAYKQERTGVDGAFVGSFAHLSL